MGLRHGSWPVVVVVVHPEGKLYLDQMVNRGSTRGAEEMERMSKGEVLSMLKFGADRIFKNDAGRMLTEDELDAIIDRSAMQEDMDTQASGGKPSEGTGGQATPAPAANGGGVPSVPAAAPSMFADGKHSAADFHADDPPISTFEFAGTDYKELRQQVQSSSLKELASIFWEEKRRRTQRIMQVDGYDVLREDNYTMAEGGISANSNFWERHHHPHHLPQRHSRVRVQRTFTLAHAVFTLLKLLPGHCLPADDYCCNGRLAPGSSPFCLTPRCPVVLSCAGCVCAQAAAAGR